MGNLRLFPAAERYAPTRCRASPEKTDHPRYSAEPVKDYWQALHRLHAHLEETGEYYLTGPIPFCIEFVADLYWLKPEIVRRDLAKIARSI